MKIYPSRIFRLIKTDSSGRHEWLHFFRHDGEKYILDHFMRIEDGGKLLPDPERKLYPDDLRVPLQTHIDKYNDPEYINIYYECSYTEIPEEEKFMIYVERL
jgi:hypothetical protein